ncbi:MAG: carboxymuconolactone decarboxylase family protein [Gemmataceae bacterium]
MPHVQPLRDEQASPQAHALFEKIQGAFKMVPNIFRTMGHAPSVLEATLALNQAIQGDLDPKLRELAYLKSSQVNHCTYCQHYHTGAARKVGLSEEQVRHLEAFETSSVYSALEKLVLRFAEQWARRGKVEEEVVAALSRSLSPAQLMVLAATVGLANWTNRFNETFDIQLP